MGIDNPEIQIAQIDRQKKLSSNFELLNSANMPNGINRYRIVNYSEGKIDIVGNFFENVFGSIEFKLANGESIKDYGVGTQGNNKLALIIPLAFANEKGTEGITIINGIKKGEVINYWGDNAIVWFKDGKSGIIKVKIGNNSKSKIVGGNQEIKAFYPEEQNMLDKILEVKNGYSICQQISIMSNGEISAQYIGQTENSKREGRRYRFFVETKKGTFGVVDFKEEITINEAVKIMKNNGIKNAVYADIISYNIYFGDKNGKFYTREEGNKGESEYFGISTDTILKNKNSIIIRGE